MGSDNNTTCCSSLYLDHHNTWNRQDLDLLHHVHMVTNFALNCSWSASKSTGVYDVLSHNFTKPRLTVAEKKIMAWAISYLMHLLDPLMNYYTPPENNNPQKQNISKDDFLKMLNTSKKEIPTENS